jgi:hypothetical protein
MKTVIAGTDIKLHTTKNGFPAEEEGKKSPYPMVNSDVYEKEKASVNDHP